MDNSEISAGTSVSAKECYKTVNTGSSLGVAVGRGISPSKLENILDENLMCSVCQDIFVEPCVLSCNHTFCRLCLSMWRDNNSTCPVCRQPIETVSKCLALEQLADSLATLLPEELKVQQEERKRERREQQVKRDQEHPNVHPNIVIWVDDSGTSTTVENNIANDVARSPSVSSPSLSSSTNSSTDIPLSNVRETLPRADDPAMNPHVALTPLPADLIPTSVDEFELYLSSFSGEDELSSMLDGTYGSDGQWEMSVNPSQGLSEEHEDTPQDSSNNEGTIEASMGINDQIPHSYLDLTHNNHGSAWTPSLSPNNQEAPDSEHGQYWDINQDQRYYVIPLTGTTSYWNPLEASNVDSLAVDHELRNDQSMNSDHSQPFLRNGEPTTSTYQQQQQLEDQRQSEVDDLNRSEECTRLLNAYEQEVSEIYNRSYDEYERKMEMARALFVARLRDNIATDNDYDETRSYIRTLVTEMKEFLTDQLYQAYRKQIDIATELITNSHIVYDDQIIELYITQTYNLCDYMESLVERMTLPSCNSQDGGNLLVFPQNARSSGSLASSTSTSGLHSSVQPTGRPENGSNDGRGRCSRNSSPELTECTRSLERSKNLIRDNGDVGVVWAGSEDTVTLSAVNSMTANSPDCSSTFVSMRTDVKEVAGDTVQLGSRGKSNPARSSISLDVSPQPCCDNHANVENQLHYKGDLLNFGLLSNISTLVSLTVDDDDDDGDDETMKGLPEHGRDMWRECQPLESCSLQRVQASCSSRRSLASGNDPNSAITLRPRQDLLTSEDFPTTMDQEVSLSAHPCNETCEYHPLEDERSRVGSVMDESDSSSTVQKKNVTFKDGEDSFRVSVPKNSIRKCSYNLRQRAIRSDSRHLCIRTNPYNLRSRHFRDEALSRKCAETDNDSSPERFSRHPYNLRSSARSYETSEFGDADQSPVPQSSDTSSNMSSNRTKRSRSPLPNDLETRQILQRSPFTRRRRSSNSYMGRSNVDVLSGYESDFDESCIRRYILETYKSTSFT